MQDSNLMLYMGTAALSFVYSLLIFDFSSRILDGARKNLWVHFLFSLVNAGLMMWTIFSHTSYFISFLGCLAFLIFEFRLFSKATLHQCLFGASVFALHIVLLFTPSLIVFSKIFGVTPITVATTPALHNQVIFFIALLLILLLLIVRKAIPISYIKRVSRSKSYAYLIIAFGVASLLSAAAVATLLIDDQSYDLQLIFSIGATALNLTLFYFTFLYTIQFVNMITYKRQAVKAQLQYRDILKQKETILEKVDKDHLTGIYNKTFINAYLEKLHSDTSKQFSVIFADINGLKYVNDTYGHEVGDKLIVLIADAIRTSLRSHDYVARVGGDELLVVLTDNTPTDVPYVLARIDEKIQAQDQAHEFPLSASFGHADVAAGIRTVSLEYVLDQADRNMRKNKAEFYAKRGQYHE